MHVITLLEHKNGIYSRFKCVRLQLEVTFMSPQAKSSTERRLEAARVFLTAPRGLKLDTYGLLLKCVDKSAEPASHPSEASACLSGSFLASAGHYKFNTCMCHEHVICSQAGFILSSTSGTVCLQKFSTLEHRFNVSLHVSSKGTCWKSPAL